MHIKRLGDREGQTDAQAAIDTGTDISTDPGRQRDVQT